MCNKWFYLVHAVLTLIMIATVPAGAAVPITVENYSFEIPNDGAKRDISVGKPGVVTGWARIDPTTSAGREFGWTPTNGTATGFMGNDAVIYNLTDFLAMEGDTFHLTFDSRSTWQANTLRAQLYYNVNGTRMVFATMDIDITPGTPPPAATQMKTFNLDSNSVDLAARDCKIGIQFQHKNAGKWVNATTGEIDTNIWCGLDWIELELTSPLMRAQNPSPKHESSYGASSATLTWVPGPNAPAVNSYHVYFSDNWADVNEGTAAADKSSTSTASYSVSDLTQGLTYYWRVDSVIGADIYRGNIWKFTIVPTFAYNPNPATNTELVSVDTILSWEAGTGAVKGHVIFFGDNFNDVNNALSRTMGSPPFRVFSRVPADVNWAPSEAKLILETSKTYYWRVDEVQSISPLKMYKGEVWQFTTVPIKGLGSITRDVWEGISGLAVSDLTSDPNYPDGPSYTEMLTSFEAPHMAIVEYGSRIYGWLYIRSSGEYTFCIASGENSQLWFGTHPSTASIIAFVDSQEGRAGWTEPRQYDKFPDIQKADPIYLQNGTLYYIMALHKKGWGHDNLSVAWSGPDSNGVQEVIPGTSLIPFDQVELVAAAGPNPRDQATDVSRQPTLSWIPGQYAAAHEIYFGKDFNSVNDAGTSTTGIYTGRQPDPNYAPGTLEFNTTYYWRVDEVNDAHPDKLWKGMIWRFTTGNFLVVDDFEGYNDVDNIIYNTWSDYYTNNTGMTVGHLEAPFAEQRIFHTGSKAMYMHYDNDGTVNEGTNFEQAGTLLYSEAQRQWNEPQDWTKEGVNSLALWFRGIPASFGSFTPGPPIYTMTARGTDIWGTSDQLHFAFKQVSGEGTIIAKVTRVDNTNQWAKAGVMIRQTLDADSPHAMVVVTPGQGVAFQRRTIAAIDSESTTDPNFTAPLWVRLTRSGNTFAADYSTNGSSWTPLGTPVPILMPTITYAGLCLTGHNVAETCTAEFSNVTMPASATGQWENEDIGITSNTADQLYVVLQDSAGNSSPMVSNSDPAATTIAVWTPWNIPLTDFAGVDMKAIKKMIIGVGDRNNTQPAGEGDLYIDDIRLNLPALTQ